jgi:transcriptional regulator with XRE-family HTH domain
MVYIISMKAHELRKWRPKNGYSQAQLAKVLGVDVMTVSRWERGVREIPSFLHLALAYLEREGKETQPTGKRKRERRK